MSNELMSKILEVLNSINKSLNNDLDKWNFGILLLTLIVLGIYTWFTYGILKENKKIREKEFMPFLNLDGHNFSSSNEMSKPFQGCLGITNIGKGIGFNITVDDLFINGFNLHFKQKIDSLFPEKTPIQRAEIMAITRKFDRKSPNSKKVVLRCIDQIGNKYRFEYGITNLNVKPVFIRMKNYKFIK